MKTSRINKWKEYREMILNNENIEQSIINSDPELLSLINQIDFDFSNIFDEREYIKNREKNDYYKKQEEFRKIDSIIEEILKNESMKSQNSTSEWDVNSHTYDQYIHDNFSDFQEETNELQSKTSTTDLKVKKVSI